MTPIFVNITIANGTRRISVRAIVDTGSDDLILPIAFKSDLGEFPEERPIKVVLADGTESEMIHVLPAMITIEGFPPVGDEVLFGAGDSVLLGHWPMQKAKAIIDEVNHRLVADPSPHLCVGCREVWTGHRGNPHFSVGD